MFKREKEDLVYTETSSMKETTGFAFGLEGNLFLFLISGIMASIGTLILTNSVFHMPMLEAVVISIIPLGLVMAYLKIFRINKPPHFQEDFFENLLAGNVYSRDMMQRENPYYTKIIEAELGIKIEKRGNKK